MFQAYCGLIAFGDLRVKTLKGTLSGSSREFPAFGACTTVVVATQDKLAAWVLPRTAGVERGSTPPFPSGTYFFNDEKVGKKMPPHHTLRQLACPALLRPWGPDFP